MRKVAASIALALTLSGCSTAGVLSAATSALGGSKPEVTAQLGAENTKQGIGLNSKVTTEDKQSLGDIKAGTAVVKQQKTQKKAQAEVGAIEAQNVQIVTSDNKALLASFALGLAAVVGLVVWAARRRDKKEEV